MKALYVKPKDLRYVDCAIWIDANAYRDDLTETEKEQIYEYIYHLTKMLAYKNKLFSRNQYYEDFAIYSAGRTYLRLTNPKQWNNGDKPLMKPIKSILNFIKATLYPHKVDFEQEFYAQTLQPEDKIDEYVPYEFLDKLYESTDDLRVTEFKLCLEDICTVAKIMAEEIKDLQIALKDYDSICERIGILENELNN